MRRAGKRERLCHLALDLHCFLGVSNLGQKARQGRKRSCRQHRSGEERLAVGLREREVTAQRGLSMGSLIYVWLVDFIHKDPQEIWKWIHEAITFELDPRSDHFKGVQMIYHLVEERKYALELNLGVPLQHPSESGVLYQYLTFTSDGRVIATGKGKEISPQEAMDFLLRAYLQLRRAAALTRRMLAHRHVRKDETYGSLDWTACEHGYTKRLPMSASPAEEELLEARFEEIKSYREMGMAVLRVPRNEHSIQVREIVKKTFPPLPRETGIEWSAGVPLRGARVQTHLAEWLDVPSEKIVQTLARASLERDILLALDVLDEPARVLRFEGGRISLMASGSDKSPTAMEEDHAVRLVAESKLNLRRASVYAAWARSVAVRQGIREERLIRMDALGAYGYAKEGNVPPSVRTAIESHQAELVALYRTGLRVLEICRRVARG